MANEEQELVPNQQEDAQNRVMMMVRHKEDKVCNGGDSEGLSNSLPHLPSDIIIYDILTRVPVDSLMRFQCVCKSWSKLATSDSQFIKLHCLRQPYSNRGFICIGYTSTYEDFDDSPCDIKRRISKCYGLVLYDFDKKEETKFFEFRPESGILDYEEVYIEDSLNGLVLLFEGKRASSSHYAYNYKPLTDPFTGCSHYVYNPITGYSYEVPVRNAFVRGCQANHYYHLVFDSVMEKYKVLCLRMTYGPGTLIEDSVWSLKIVTLGTENDSWRDVAFPKKMHSYLTNGGFRQVFANGSFNWLTCEDEILSIDVTDEVFYTIKCPKESSRRSKLFQIQGSLCFLDYTDNFNPFKSEESAPYSGELELWILKEDEQKKNGRRHGWIQMYHIDMFTDVLRTEIRSGCFPVITGVVMDPTPKIIFAFSPYFDERDISRYHSYDLNLKRLDYINEPPFDRICKWHVNSLARL